MNQWEYILLDIVHILECSNNLEPQHHLQNLQFEKNHLAPFLFEKHSLLQKHFAIDSSFVQYKNMVFFGAGKIQNAMLQ